MWLIKVNMQSRLLSRFLSWAWLASVATIRANPGYDV